MLKTYVDPHELGLDVKKINGAEAICICPFHDDSTPSLSFNTEQGVFICFGCGISGTASDIAEATGGRVFKTPNPIDSTGVSRMYGTSSDDWSEMLRWPLAADLPVYPDYLDSRMVSASLARATDIRYNERTMTLAFPFYGLASGGEPPWIIGFQTRAVDMKAYRFWGSRTRTWPSISVLGEIRERAGGEWRERQKSYIVEGVFGALRGLSAGYTTRAICGSGNWKNFNVLANFPGMKTVFDDDPAGWKASAGMLAYGFPFCKVTGCEPDEWSISQWREVVDKNHFSSDLSLLKQRDRSVVKIYSEGIELSKERRSGWR